MLVRKKTLYRRVEGVCVVWECAVAVCMCRTAQWREVCRVNNMHRCMQE